MGDVGRNLNVRMVNTYCCYYVCNVCRALQHAERPPKPLESRGLKAPYFLFKVLPLKLTHGPSEALSQGRGGDSEGASEVAANEVRR
jgi:hypothetical protein